MAVKQLRSAISATPFRPFTLRMVDGRSFPVRHPDFIERSPLGRTLIVYRDDESHGVFDMLLVTELEVHADRGERAA